jgi:hypothetical protein
MLQRNIRWVFICTLLKNKLQRSVVISKTVITGGEIIKEDGLINWKSDLGKMKRKIVIISVIVIILIVLLSTILYLSQFHFDFHRITEV